MQGWLWAHLLPDGLDQHPTPPSAIEFAVEDPLPPAQGPGEQSETIEPAVGHRDHHLVAHDLPLQVGVGIVPSIPSGQASPVRLCPRSLDRLPPGWPGRSAHAAPAFQATPRNRGAIRFRRR